MADWYVHIPIGHLSYSSRTWPRSNACQDGGISFLEDKLGMRPHVEYLCPALCAYNRCYITMITVKVRNGLCTCYDCVGLLAGGCEGHGLSVCLSVSWEGGTEDCELGTWLNWWLLFHGLNRLNCVDKCLHEYSNFATCHGVTSIVLQKEVGRLKECPDWATKRK